MLTTTFITIAVFLGVAALVGGVALVFRDRSESRMEGRLDMFTSAGTPAAAKDRALKQSVLSSPLEQTAGVFEALVERVSQLKLLFEQADTKLTPSRFFALSAGLAVGSAATLFVAGIQALAIPVAAGAMGLLPLVWLWWRRKRRLKAFAVQLPDALELIARALRAGHSLAAGFNLVQDEMTAPLGTEFGRVFEEQNLGIPIEEALESLTARVPNLDLKFFCTAVILQRQTGGDLAEILDKIGSLIRERFKIWGQIQALTGEGRLSGVVLLALPPLLFLAVYKLNPDYVMVLFTDPMGKKLLAGGVILQVLGALVIRKIVNIKV